MQNYPFRETHHCGAQCSLNACCDNHFKPDHAVPTPPKQPTGYIKENGFRIIAGYPYLCDTTNIKYGPFVNVAEQIDTQIAQRPTSGCVHLDATFDCTNSTNTNGTLFNYLKTIIERKYESLQGILPVIQEYVHFRVKYYVTNAAGTTVGTGSPVLSIKESWLHGTSVPGYFVQSFKGVLIDEFADFSYYGSGLYTITIESVEVILTAIDTISHLTDPALNDYYAFINNYTKIAVDHTKVNALDPDMPSLVIATVPINKSFGFQSAVTTKVKICFTAYLSDMITTGNTFDIWAALTEPTSEIINSLRTSVATLTTTCNTLTTGLAAANVSITNLETALAALTLRVKALEDKDGTTTDTPAGGNTTGDNTSGGSTTNPPSGGGSNTDTNTPGGNTSGGSDSGTGGDTPSTDNPTDGDSSSETPGGTTTDGDSSSSGSSTGDTTPPAGEGEGNTGEGGSDTSGTENPPAGDTTDTTPEDTNPSNPTEGTDTGETPDTTPGSEGGETQEGTTPETNGDEAP